jgi:hypothetical protein
MTHGPLAWREPRTFSTITEYGPPHAAEYAAEWHRTHKAPPRTYARWPLWEGLERAYEEDRLNVGYPPYQHPSKEEMPFSGVPLGIYRRMPIDQAVATPPALPYTFPRLAQPAVPVGRAAPSQSTVYSSQSTVQTPPVGAGASGAPQVAGYQIVGQAVPATGISWGMVALAVVAGVSLGYLACHAGTGGVQR